MRVNKEDIKFPKGTILQFDNYNVGKHYHDISEITYAEVASIHMDGYVNHKGIHKKNGVYIKLKNVKGPKIKWRSSEWVRANNFKLLQSIEEYQIF